MREHMKKIATMRKAVVAFILPMLATAGASMADGNLTGPEIIASIGAGLAIGASVYAVPNEAA